MRIQLVGPITNITEERAMQSLKIQRTSSSDDLVMTRLRVCVKLRALEQGLLPANTKCLKIFCLQRPI